MGRSVVIVEEEGALVIDLPSRRQWFLLVFLPFPMLWCTLWMAALPVRVTILLFHLVRGIPVSDGIPFLALLFWLVPTFFAVYLWAAWLWNGFGREVVRIQGNTMTLRYTVFGIGPERSMNRHLVTAVRSHYPEYRSSWEERLTDRRTDLFGTRDATIAFDYAGQTVWLGSGITERDMAARIGELIQRRVGPRMNIA